MGIHRYLTIPLLLCTASCGSPLDAKQKEAEALLAEVETWEEFVRLAESIGFECSQSTEVIARCGWNVPRDCDPDDFEDDIGLVVRGYYPAGKRHGKNQVLLAPCFL